jgi:molybdopterin-guanine dinucleotide biosynthesis protein A
MRVNKAFLRLNGTPLIEMMLDKVSDFEEVLIVTNAYDDYAHLEGRGVEVVKDIFPHEGPLSGIHAGLSFMKNGRAMVLPCDMPLVPREVVDYLVDLADAHPSHDVFVPAEGDLYQPLCAVYRRSCLHRIETALRQGRRKLQDIYGQLDVYPVPMEELARYGDPEVFFENANDPQCFEKLRRAGATRRLSAVYSVKVNV